MKRWNIFEEAFSHRGSFDEVCELKAAGPAIQTDWDQACEVKYGDGTVPFDQAQLSSDSKDGVAICKSFVGPTPKEFKGHFKRTPEQAGLKLQDLPGANGKQYKGVLM
eukprot:3361943-Pyramimonas_sp.AAC.1